ncbi:hypothetical protein ONE63_000832 [Megalurothrips usitatus]|uniref:Gustatory receptor n=1 Tax=Megalurothrips usitatus TaxID=439358 RepID=A0AAV7Y0R6_9NEOP|nr:hypothetical protein ONE63_000832 [Megalurothrips usitatus]
MFGGHGMFADLQPIGLSMALFGLLPVTFRPVRVSFHPLRSTLAYCLAWLALVLWSLHRMVTDRVRLLSEAAAAGRELSMQTQFTTVLCLAFPGGLVLLPLVWVESRRLQSNVAYGTHCQNLMRSFGHIHRSCRLARGLSWVMVVFTLLVSPLVAVLWLSVVAAEGSHWTHVFVNNHVLLLLFEVSAFFSSLFHCAKTFGRNLSECLSKELSLPYPCASRLAEYRRAWLELRDVTRALVVLPLTALALLIFVLVTFTLQMYLTLVCAIEAQYALGFLIFLMALSFISQVLLVCDAVHRAVDVVGNPGHWCGLGCCVCVCVCVCEGSASDAVLSLRR